MCLVFSQIQPDGERKKTVFNSEFCFLSVVTKLIPNILCAIQVFGFLVLKTMYQVVGMLQDHRFALGFGF